MANEYSEFKKRLERMERRRVAKAKLEFLPQTRVSRIENEIAVLEVQGYSERAKGIRDLFSDFLDEGSIQDIKNDMRNFWEA